MFYKIIVICGLLKVLFLDNAFGTFLRYECQPASSLVNPDFLDYNKLVYATWTNVTKSQEKPEKWSILIANKRGVFIGKEKFVVSSFKNKIRTAGKFFLTKEEEVYVFYLSGELGLQGYKYRIEEHKKSKRPILISKKLFIKSEQTFEQANTQNFNFDNLFAFTEKEREFTFTLFAYAEIQGSIKFCEYVIDYEQEEIFEIHQSSICLSFNDKSFNCFKHTRCLVDITDIQVFEMTDTNFKNEEHALSKCHFFRRRKIMSKEIKYMNETYLVSNQLFMIFEDPFYNLTSEVACFDMFDFHFNGVLWHTQWNKQISCEKFQLKNHFYELGEHKDFSFEKCQSSNLIDIVPLFIIVVIVNVLLTCLLILLTIIERAGQKRKKAAIGQQKKNDDVKGKVDNKDMKPLNKRSQYDTEVKTVNSVFSVNDSLY